MLLKSRIFAGAEKVAIDIMLDLQEEFDFYYVSPYGEIAEKLKTYKLKYIPLNNFQIGEIRRVIHLIQPDIVHAHDFSASVVASLLKSFTGNPKLISHIHCNAKENLIWGKKAILYRIALRKIDCVISVSEAIVEEAVFRKALRSKVKILGNPIDKARILQMAMAERQEDSAYSKRNGKKDDVYLYDLIFVGRLSRQKNPQKFIKIIAMLKKAGQDVHTALIGEGELHNECKQFIQRYHLEQQVVMLGFLENPYPIIKNSRILCMTSEEEGFGLAVAEAMVLGVPVLVSEVGGMKKLLGTQAEEFCKTEQEYVRKIILLLQDKTLYQAAQTRMKEKAEKFPDRQNYMEQIRKLYKEL